jgi:hypothetical protein
MKVGPEHETAGHRAFDALGPGRPCHPESRNHRVVAVNECIEEPDRRPLAKLQVPAAFRFQAFSFEGTRLREHAGTAFGRAAASLRMLSHRQYRHPVPHSLCEHRQERHLAF